MLSQGVPMLLGGDELGRTQSGNNNAYCQDNGISWFDWTSVDGPLLDFSRELIRLRREHPVFRRRRWFQRRPIHGSKVRDIAWFRPNGKQMSEKDWNAGKAGSLAVYLHGGALDLDPRGEPVTDDDFLLLFNADHRAVAFRLPLRDWGNRWQRVLDTALDEPNDEIFDAGAALRTGPRSLVVLIGR